MSVISERYEALVTNNEDDEQRGRIKVACVGLLGDEEAELPMWVEPALDWGFFFVPDVGEIVEVEVVTHTEQDEHFGQSSIDNLDIRWHGTRYYTEGDGDQTEPRAVHNDFVAENYGKRRGFATPAGHILMFDDTEGKTKVVLTWVQEIVEQGEAPEETKISQLIIDTDGTIKLGVLGKHFIHLKENEVEIQLDEGANLKLSNKDADAEAILGDGAVKVAIADHLEALYGDLKTYIEGAIVPTGMGPSGTVQAGSGPAPSWDSNINSSKLSVPDT